MTNDELRRKIAEVRGIEFDVYDFVVGDPSLVYKDSNDDIPNWPVNIVDAWELVEEMIKNNDYPIPSITRVDDDNLWHCFYRVAGDMGYDEYSADTAPRAICLAYIAYKESQK